MIWRRDNATGKGVQTQLIVRGADGAARGAKHGLYSHGAL